MVCLGSHGVPAPPGTPEYDVYITVIRLIIDNVMLVLIILLNGIIIFAVLRFRWRQYQGFCVCETSTDISLTFVLNLSLADLLVGFVTIYSLSFEYFCVVDETVGHHKYACVMRYALVLFTTSASGYSLVAIAADRYIAVVYALRYHEIMSPTRIRCIVFGIWFSAFMDFTSAIVINYWDDTQSCTSQATVPWVVLILNGVIMHVVITGFIIAVHIKIYKEVLLSDQMHLRNGMLNAPLPASKSHPSKSARTLIHVTLCYVVCWFPFLVLMITRVAGVRSYAWDLAYSIAYSVANTNFLLSPSMYGWKNRVVRAALESLFHKCKKRRDKVSISRCGRTINTLSPYDREGRPVHHVQNQFNIS